MAWDLNPRQSWIPLHLSGVTREIFFGTSIAGFNFPLKTNALSWSQSICFSYFHPLSPTPS